MIICNETWNIKVQGGMIVLTKNKGEATVFSDEHEAEKVFKRIRGIFRSIAFSLKEV